MVSSPGNVATLSLKLLFQLLALALLAGFQVDEDFKPLKKVFHLEKTNKTDIFFSLEAAAPVQIQLAYRVAEKEPIDAVLTLTINGKKLREIQVKEIGGKKIKFVAPPSLFKSGENRMAWDLKASRPGFILEEIKLVNYAGMNPSIPVAWAISDEIASQLSAPGNTLWRLMGVVFLILLAVTLYATVSRLFFFNDLYHCLSTGRKALSVSILFFAATLLYSTLTPQKIIYPTATVFWVVGLSLLSILLPAILVKGHLNQLSSIKKTGITLTLIGLISILAYLSFFKNGWYVQDDYLSIHWGLGNPNVPMDMVVPQARTGGDFNAIMESTKSIVNLLYKGQGRYQPARLFVFMAFMHYFQEEQSLYNNFALHLANLVLLFFLLRKFKVEPVVILLSILLFSLFGRWRMMESPSAMIAGSGLNLFLISLTLLFLIKALEPGNTPAKKIFFWLFSWSSYLFLVFSYEVAFPLILPILFTYFIFGQKPEVFRESERAPSWFNIRRLSGVFMRRETLCLSPYFIFLITYLLCFNLTAKGEYPGTTISWRFADILTRFTNYVSHTISLRINLNHLGVPEIAILLLYYALAILAVRAGKPSLRIHTQKTSHLNALLFGGILYFSSMVLFFLNSWETPSNIMVHHLYLMTAGASIMTVTLLFQAQWFLPKALLLKKSTQGRFIAIPLKKYYRNFLVFGFFPLVLASESSYLSRYYATHDVGSALIKPIKTGIQNQIDPKTTDAIIIKNFHHNYHGMSSVEGAFMHWLHLDKIIASGRPILSANDNTIAFMRPLSHYWLIPNIQHESPNNRTQILFLENERLLPYHDFIDFEEKTNLHQTQQVWGDEEPVEYRHHRLDAILKNDRRADYLEIKVRSDKELEHLMANTTRIEVNGKRPPQALASGGSLFIDIRAAKNSVNYFFLTLVSTDKNVKDSPQLIRLQNPEKETVMREIEHVPVGEDTWGIG